MVLRPKAENQSPNGPHGTRRTWFGLGFEWIGR
jgi:hypothetical protein